jgi:hypothetical protein
VRLGCAGSGVTGSVGRCGVEQVVQGRMSGVGGVGMRAGSIGWVHSWSVGPLGSGDGSLVHHSR